MRILALVKLFRTFISRAIQICQLEIHAQVQKNSSSRANARRTFFQRNKAVAKGERTFSWYSRVVTLESRFGPVLIHVHDFLAKQIKLRSDLTGEIAVLDIGANVGQFGIAMLSNFDAVTIFSFEPNQVPFRILQMNSVSESGWHVFNKGIAEETKKSEFYWTPGRSGQGSIHSANASLDLFNKSGADVMQNTVDFIAIDDAIAIMGNRNSFDLVKIDVEGLEAEILKQLHLINWRYVLVEVSQKRNGCLSELEALGLLRSEFTDPEMISRIGNIKSSTYDILVRNTQYNGGKASSPPLQ
jgi:FkbM family methyltransferase